MVLFLSGLVNGLGRAVSSGIELMDSKYFIISDSAEDIITVSNIEPELFQSLNEQLSGNITSSVISEITVRLEKAVANSKKVDQVKELTDDILSISSQTNLLALNASIEAARAGEVGIQMEENSAVAKNLKNDSSNFANL